MTCTDERALFRTLRRRRPERKRVGSEDVLVLLEESLHGDTVLSCTVELAQLLKQGDPHGEYRLPRATLHQHRVAGPPAAQTRFEAECEQLLSPDVWPYPDDPVETSVAFIDKRNCSVVGGRMDLGCMSDGRSRNVWWDLNVSSPHVEGSLERLQAERHATAPWEEANISPSATVFELYIKVQLPLVEMHCSDGPFVACTDYEHGDLSLLFIWSKTRRWQGEDPGEWHWEDHCYDAPYDGADLVEPDMAVLTALP
jgi:hypothetical protein